MGKRARCAESAFDAAYLVSVVAMGAALIAAGRGAAVAAGVMALVLAAGDGFHLIPRVAAHLFPARDFSAALGRGRQIASIGMTLFYLILWFLGARLGDMRGMTVLHVLYVFLAAARVVLCLLPQNGWTDGREAPGWRFFRNLPFFLMGLVAAILYFVCFRSGGLCTAWLAIALSFAFYLPVCLYADKNPGLGMLMIPKTLSYVWLIALFFCLI